MIIWGIIIKNVWSTASCTVAILKAAIAQKLLTTMLILNCEQTLKTIKRKAQQNKHVKQCKPEFLSFFVKFSASLIIVLGNYVLGGGKNIL